MSFIMNSIFANTYAALNTDSSFAIQRNSQADLNIAANPGNNLACCFETKRKTTYFWITN